MLVVLRMNRDFMKYMRKYYAHIDRACFVTLITSEGNMESDEPIGVAESDGAGGAEPDGAGGAASGRGAGGAKSGSSAGGAKSVNYLQQRSLISLFGEKTTPNRYTLSYVMSKASHYSKYAD